MSIYAINNFQADAPHWDIAYIEADSPEEAKAILLSKIGTPDDDNFDRPDTVWSVTDADSWRVWEEDRPLLFILGGGCR